MEFEITQQNIEIDGTPARRFSCGLVAFTATEKAYKQGTATDEMMKSMVSERCHLILELPDDDARSLICYDEAMQPVSYSLISVKKSIVNTEKLADQVRF